jgi:hypothetical protein
VVPQGKPTVSSGRKATVLGARRRVRRTPPGSESGACSQRGSAGTWENPRSPCHIPGMADRVTNSPGVVWGPRPGHAPGRDTTNEPKRTRYRDVRDKRSDRRGAGGQSSRSIVPGQGGTGGPQAPREGRQRRASRGAGQTDGSYREITTRHPTTPAPCGAGRPRSGPGVYAPGPPDCARRSAGGVPANEPVEGRRDRWGDGAAVARAPGRARARPARATTQRPLSGSTRRARLDGESRRGAASDGEANVRGEEGPKSGGDAAGSNLGARRLRRLVGLSARPQPASCPARTARAGHDGGEWLDRGCRCQWRLRQYCPDSTAGRAPPTGQ